MRAFFGGQIKEECRGDLAAIVCRPQPGDENDLCYSIFVYPILSDDFVHLTGVRDTTNPFERAYIGISSETGNKIAAFSCYRADLLDLRKVDELVVTPHFLDKYLDKPKRIVLESTRDGYEVKIEKE